MDERGTNMADAGDLEMGALKPCISYQYIMYPLCTYHFIIYFCYWSEIYTTHTLGVDGFVTLAVTCWSITRVPTYTGLWWDKFVSVTKYPSPFCGENYAQ